MDGRVLAALIIAGAFAGWGVWYIGRAWLVTRRLGGNRSVHCPETDRPATVHIDLALAVTSDRGSAPAPLDSCSNWPERANCEQPCVEAAHLPETSASVLVKEWAKGRPCAMCRGPVTESWLSGHHIAVLEPTGMTREWVDIGADRLALALATSLPLCWNCHVAETFRRTHPELIVDRDDDKIHLKETKRTLSGTGTE
jgi:hypothetical protein